MLYSPRNSIRRSAIGLAGTSGFSPPSSSLPFPLKITQITTPTNNRQLRRAKHCMNLSDAMRFPNCFTNASALARLSPIRSASLSMFEMTSRWRCNSSNVATPTSFEAAIKFFVFPSASCVLSCNVDASFNMLVPAIVGSTSPSGPPSPPVMKSSPRCSSACNAFRSALSVLSSFSIFLRRFVNLLRWSASWTNRISILNDRFVPVALRIVSSASSNAEARSTGSDNDWTPSRVCCICSISSVRVSSQY
mmetsp:Transcript_46955/g.47747  ORF Transcript_46955/g.47747 Transcript_46955/m.47747 type:complete len:249 (-) Transcript_46955:71-817(-)